MSSQLENAIAEYRSTKNAAFDKLKEQVQLELERTCRRWGFRFEPGWDGWYVGFVDEEMSNAYRRFIEFVEPTLFEALSMEPFGNKELASYLKEVQIQTEEYEWVILRANKEGTLRIDIIDANCELDHEKYEYHGFVSRQAAAAIMRCYDKGFKSWRGYRHFLPKISKPYTD